MAGFDHDDTPDRPAHEAEELMRQRRYGDAAARYQDLITREPTDLWIRLGWISALECAGNLDDARSQLEETDRQHRRSAPFQRFRHLFFVRREDFTAAAASQRALRHEVIDDGPDDMLADLYFNQGRYLEARSELERLLDQGPEDDSLRASALARLGASLRQTGDVEAARTRLLEALELEPGSHWTLTELAEAERARGDVEAARTRYRQALEAEANDHWAKGHLAQLEFEDGHPEIAVSLYEEIITAQPNAAWPLVELAQVLTEKDPSRASELANRALELDPRNPWAHAQLGTLARRAGRPEEARERYQRALEGSPGAIWILHELADTCRQLGRIEDGYGHLRRALEEDPYHAVSHGYMADFLRHEGKGEAALPHLAKAVEIDAEYAWGWRELSEIHALAGRHAEADAAYAKVRDLDGDAAVADGLKAFLLRSRNQRETALPWLERATDKQPDYLWAWRERIETLLGLDRVGDALAVAAQAVVHLPEVGSLHALHAETLRRSDQRAAALLAVDRAIALTPEVPQPWAIRAELMLGLGDHPAAEMAARKAVILAESAVEYRVLLAQILTARGRESEARGMVEAILNAPSPPPPVFELGAHLAERAGDREGALAWCIQGLAGPCRDDPRLLVRRARLAGHGPGKDFAPVFTQADGASVPWRDIAALYAQAEQPIEARRAAYRGLEEGAAGSGAVRAWLTVAETELHLSSPGAAKNALDRVLALDPDHLQGRLLGALLAEGRGDRPQALVHLHHLEARLLSGDAADQGFLREPILVLQLAVLYERSGEIPQARKIWERILAHQPDDRETAVLWACFLVRHGEATEAEGAIRRAESLLADQPSQRRRLWRDVALAEAGRQGAAAGYRRLKAKSGDLDGELRVLAARLALTSGEAAAVGDVLAQVALPEARPIRIRAALALGHQLDALAEAEAWRQEAPGDEEAAVLLAECQAGQGHFRTALALLSSPALPARASTERILLTSILALEVHGPAWCLGVLAASGSPDLDIPMVRVIAAAWPGAWAIPDADCPATPEDVLALPPFPQVCRHLGQALITAGRADLAATFLMAALDFHRRNRASWWRAWWYDRALRRWTCRALVAAGRRMDAWRTAWRAGDPWALLP